MRKLLLFIALIALCSYDTVHFNYLPTSNGEVVSHAYYTISYIEEYEQAEWVAYELGSSNMNGLVKRISYFTLDGSVSTGSASTNDYTGSGYDRGHLCPAADMQINEASIKESFLMSNVSPQHPSFNRGKWKQLETDIRDWALDCNHLYIVTGPAFIDSIGVIGENEVEIPSHFYKVVFDYTDPGYKMIGFLMPNGKYDETYKDFVVTVDSVESVTNIDFFHHLPDDLEDELENYTNYELWNKQK